MVFRCDARWQALFAGRRSSLRRSFAMGICPSNTADLRWDQRWSTAESKRVLKKFHKEEMEEDMQVSTDSPSGKVLRGVSKDGQFRNWAASVQTSPARVFRPTSVEEVQGLLKKARDESPIPKIRCMGSGHSWTPLFGDDGSWVFDTSGMKGIQWSARDEPFQVTIEPGVTPGDLGTFFDSKDRGEYRGLFLPADVVLETVTYGGTINSACHGTGHTQTLPDYVVSTTIVKLDGTVVQLKRADDPKGFPLKVLHFGLLGVSAAFTLQLDRDVSAIKVSDSKVRARELFLEMDELPETGGPNPLLNLWKSTYAVEIFYFPASSLKITNIWSREFEDQEWNTSSDICGIKAFQRTKKPVPKDDDSCFGIDSKTSSRFDRNFSITDWIKINLGTEVALPLVSKYGGRPSLVSAYAKAAALAFEPIGEETGEVSYETSLAQAIHWQKYITDGFPVTDVEVCIKCDPDFTSAYKAIHAAIGTTKRFAETQDTLPLNVAMEIRFTKHSDSPLSPAFGQENDVFMWIEVVSAVQTPRVKDLFTEIADAWMAITLKDGSSACLPHWAKWSEAYVKDADAKLKLAFKDRLPLLKAVAEEFDPTGAFVNNYFAKLFSS